MPVDREALREELHNLRGAFEALSSQLDTFITSEPDEGLKQSFEIARMKLGGSLEWIKRATDENEQLILKQAEPIPGAGSAITIGGASETASSTTIPAAE